MRNITLGLLALSLAACQSEGVKEAVETPVKLDAAAIHAQTLTLDTHIDIPLTYMNEIDPSGSTDLQVDLPKLDEGKLDAGFWIVYTPQGDLTEEGYSAGLKIAQKRLAAIRHMVQENSNDVELAKTAADVRRIVDNGKQAVLIGMENAYPLGVGTTYSETVHTKFGPVPRGPAGNVSEWADLGVRYMGITHFGHNQFGDSSNMNFTRDNGPKWNGLSPLGKDLVRAMNDNGIMVDVSHAGKETMMQAADLSRTPIIASHSGVKAVADSARNLDDEQLLKLKEVGGVAQMVALGSYVKLPTADQQAARDALDAEYGDRNTWDQAKRDAYMAERAKITAMAPEANVSDFVDHIDHTVKIAGIDHVGISSDFDGGGGIASWKDASETANVTAELVKRGYSEEDIAKIWGGNLLRVMEAVEKGAK